MGISLSGLGSGFDWKSLIDQLRSAEVQAKVTPLQTQQNQIQSQISAWGNLASTLSDLKSAMGSIKDASDFSIFTPTLSSSSPSVSADSILSISASSTAGRGNYNIQVTQLAQAEKLQSKSSTTKDTDAGMTGTITLNASNPSGGHDISLDGKSLQSLRDEINALNSGNNATGVTASILQVSNSDFRLILTSDTTGADGIDLTGASASFLNADKPTLQDGLNAEFTIDNISMSRSTNTITDAIPGVTLNLLSDQSPTTTVNVNMDRDYNAISGNVKSFVDSYNKVLDFIGKQTSYNEDTKTTGGPLFGDSTLKMVKSQLQNSLLNARSSQGNALSAIGITIGSDNRLSLDTDKLQTALETNYDDTVSLLNGFGQTMDTKIGDFTDDFNGTVTLRKKSMQDASDRLDDKITTTNDFIDRQMTAMQNQFITMDTAVAQMQSQQSWLSTQLSKL